MYNFEYEFAENEICSHSYIIFFIIIVLDETILTWNLELFL